MVIRMVEIAPFSLCYLILTEDCNLRCKYCYEDAGRCCDNYMSFETAKKAADFLIDNVAKYGSRNIHFTFFGGEPLLNLNVMTDIRRYVVDKASKCNINYSFSLITNCTIYNRQYEEFILEWYKVEKKVNIQISTDGIPELQDKNRITKNGKPTSEIVKENILKLKKLFKNNDIDFDFVDTHSVVTRHNIADMFSSYKYLRELGINNVSFVLPRDEYWDNDDISNYINQLILISDYVYEECIKAGNLKPYIKAQKIIGEKTNIICEAAKSVCAITPDGDIYPCHRAYFYNRIYKLGNIFDGIIENKNRKVFLDVSRNNLHVDNVSCSKCENTDCKICMAVNYKQYNDILKCSPIGCAIYKARWNFIIETKKKFYKLFNQNNYGRCGEITFTESIN